MTIGPGGFAKSTLSVGEVLSMVSGCGFLGKPTLREKLLRVAYWNLEDPIDEIMRKIQAACMRHELRPDDINGRLFVKSARDQHCIIARMLPSGGGHIVEPMVDAIIEDLRVNQIDVLYIDPFKKCHRVSENDNTMIDMVVDQWTRVAEEANVAVKLAHHTRKNGSAEIDTESSRGAKAATDAARSVVVVTHDQERGGRRGHQRQSQHLFSHVQRQAQPGARSRALRLVSPGQCRPG